jgi:hypothetical protein
MVLRFIILFRECLNNIGWQKRREHYIKCGIPLSQDRLLVKVRQQEDEMNDEEYYREEANENTNTYDKLK